MQFRLLEPPKFIPLAFKFPLKLVVKCIFATVCNPNNLYAVKIVRTARIHSTGINILFKISCEMYILQQFKKVTISMALIFRPICAIFWSELKKNEIILSFARFLANARIILLHFLYVRYNLKTTYICRHICILLIKITMLQLFPIHHIKYQCPS